MSLGRKLAWISILYLASGLPYGIAHEVWPAFLRDRGWSLAHIGLAGLAFLPWTLKFLWAPLVDLWGSRQAWVATCSLCLAGLSLALIPLDPGGGAAPLALAAVLLLFTTAAATQDIAIDAYAVDLAAAGDPDAGQGAEFRDSGPINSARVAAYRVALVVFAGGLLILAGRAGWTSAWLALAALFLTLGALAFASPRIPLDPGRRRQGLSTVLRWAARPSMVPVIAFVLIYKLGDAALMRMTKPYWIDRGASLEEIGLVATSVGMALSILGAIGGGLWVKTRGIPSALLWLGLAQAGSNLGYLAVAGLELPRSSLWAASIVESFCQGLGTAAFLSLLMALCDREAAATQFALLSALFGLSRDLAGAVSGHAAEVLGYTAYFGLTALLAVPGLLLIPLVARHLRNRAPDPPP